jgi:hypothetical protein
MNVYFVPLGNARFEPYFEPEDDAADVEVPEGAGFFARIRARFAETLREAERQRHERVHHRPTTAMGRVKRLIFRWIAERVAEQRLLWNLRTVDDAVLHVPDDTDLLAAEKQFRQILQRDGDRHLRRCGLHTLGLIVSVPVALVPGPNLFGYLFTFTAVGHLLSYLGARRGNRDVRWTIQPDAALTAVGQALQAPVPDRHRLLHEAAERLRLRRLALFVERMTVPSA